MLTIMCMYVLFFNFCLILNLLCSTCFLGLLSGILHYDGTPVLVYKPLPSSTFDV